MGHSQTETHWQHWAVTGKATCLHLCVQRGDIELQRETFAWPYPLILDRFGGNPIYAVKARPYFVLLTFHFMFWTYQRITKVGMGARCTVANSGPWTQMTLSSRHRHCLPGTYFEIRALVVCGRARYLSVTQAHLNPCPAELLQLYFLSFESGIANAISSFKLLFMKKGHI